MKTNIYSYTILWITVLFVFGNLCSCDKIDSDDYLIPLGNSEWMGQRVLLEDFTGMRCPNCPDASLKAGNLQHLYPGKVIVIANHVNLTNARTLGSPDSLTSIAGDEYFDKLYGKGPVSLPMGMINRVNSSSGKLFDRSLWDAEVVRQLFAVPSFNLDITCTYNQQTGKLIVNTTTTPQKNIEGQYSMTILIVENEIIAPQSTAEGIVTNYVHNHVLRTSITPPMGTQFINGLVKKDIAINGTYETSISGKWEKGGWANINNCSVIAFISDVQTNIISQAAETVVKK